MIGPGNGPNRAISRLFTGTPGHWREGKKKNWLFFGSQHKHCNYFYEDEFEGYKKGRLLKPGSILAWSRDQTHKSYVPAQNAGEPR